MLIHPRLTKARKIMSYRFLTDLTISPKGKLFAQKSRNSSFFFLQKYDLCFFDNYMDVKTVVAAYFFFNFLKIYIGRYEDFHQAKGIHYSLFCCQEQSEQALAGKMSPCSLFK